MIDILNVRKELSVLNKKIIKIVKKDSYLSKRQGLQLFHVFWLEYQGEFRKEDFLNHSFLNKLDPCYYTQKTFLKKRSTCQQKS